MRREVVEDGQREVVPSGREPVARLEGGSLLELQRSAGNAAAGRLLARRGLLARQVATPAPAAGVTVPAGPPPAAPAPAPAPVSDQRVRAVLDKLRREGDVDSPVEELTDAEMALFAARDRVRVIADIANGNSVAAGDEESLIRLLATTPANDREVVRSALIADGAALLRRLDSVIDGDNYKRYHKTLGPFLLGVAGPEAAMNAPTLMWSDPGPIKSLKGGKVIYAVTWTADGRLRIATEKGFPGMTLPEAPIVVAPDQPIILVFLQDDPEAGGRKREQVIVPAVNMLMLRKIQQWRDAMLALDLGLLIGGIVGGASAGSVIARVVEAIASAMGAAGMVINEYRGELGATPSGADFLRRWDRLQLVVAAFLGVKMVRDAKLIARLRDLYRGVRAALPGGQAAKLERQLDALAQQLDDAERQLSPRPAGEKAPPAEPSSAPPDKRPPEPEPKAPQEQDPIAVPPLKPPVKDRRWQMGKHPNYASAEEMRTAVKPLLRALKHGDDLNPYMKDLKAYLSRTKLEATAANKAFLEQHMVVYKAIRDPAFIENAMARLWTEASRRGVSTAEALEQIMGGGQPIPGITDLTREVMAAESTFIDLGLAADIHLAHTHMFQEYLAQLALGGERAGARFRQSIAGLTGPDVPIPSLRENFTKPLYSAAWDALFDDLIGTGHINRPEELGPVLHEHLGFPLYRP